jgi:DNA polymerase I
MTPPVDCRVFAVDFEFISNPGERPIPVCVVAQEIQTGEVTSVWLEGESAGDLKEPPYPTGKDALFISFYAPAEMTCHLVLGWDMSKNLVDLFAEHRILTNGLPSVSNSLLAACEYWGVTSIPSTEHKEQMRNLIIAGGPFSDADKKSILEYCAEDVSLTADLYSKIQGQLDLPRALFRGAYQQVVAKMEHHGIPIDVATLRRLQHNWKPLQARMVKDVDADYGVYDGLTFKADLFEQYLVGRGIAWPRTDMGRLKLDDETFKSMVKTYPFLQGLKDLRYLMGAMKLNALPVGADGRNRTMLSPFRSITGRNQPSSSKYIFGPAVWLRSLIQPEPGMALIYADYKQQEFAIAGYLSGDPAMLQAYRTGDPYLSFAKLAGAAPPEATKETHRTVREQFKLCALAVQYGMGHESLALQINRPPAYAKELLQQHRRVFKDYWAWSDRVLTDALLSRVMTTSLGWKYRISINGGDSARTIRNWPSQSHGSDILRMACVLLEKNGITVVGPIHDAVLVECPADVADAVAKKTVEIMELAATYVLGEGRTVGVDTEILRYPDRYSDERGVETWNKITRLLDEVEKEEVVVCG